jgi:hypothetical protein
MSPIGHNRIYLGSELYHNQKIYDIRELPSDIPRLDPATSFQGLIFVFGFYCWVNILKANYTPIIL